MRASRDVAQPHNILIIDDEIELAELAVLLLSRQYEDQIVIASSELSGIEMALQSPPDLIMIRIMMAGIDGYALCRRIKSILTFALTPVLLVAANQPEDVYPEAQDCGAAGYLYLPYTPDQLYAARNALLRGELYYPPLDN